MALTGKLLRFATEYLRTENAGKAAIFAGYSEKGAAQCGSRLLKKPEIQSYLRAGKSQAASYAIKRAKLEAADILARIVDIHDAALADGDYGAALRAMELYGKHLKLFADTVNIEHHHTFAGLVNLAASSRVVGGSSTAALPTISVADDSQGESKGYLQAQGGGTPAIDEGAKIQSATQRPLQNISEISEKSFSLSAAHSQSSASAKSLTVEPIRGPQQPSTPGAETQLVDVLPSGGVLPQWASTSTSVNRKNLMPDSPTTSDDSSMSAGDSISQSSDDDEELG